MTVCPETRAFRSFTDPDYREHMMRQLIEKYLKGKRSARDVLESVAALRAQLLYADADTVICEAISTVDPVPTVLWQLAWERAPYWDSDRVRGLLRLARDDPRLTKHIPVDSLTCTTHGLVALMHEASSHQTPWVIDVLLTVLTSMKSRSGTEP